ncbi:MAG: RNA methyltransferase [Epulopiscium sp. Nuni2H_MBin003]|nr:MAG: RNA methyltransferase [Epulopiscium sp. Nuni2H_MBin003]
MNLPKQFKENIKNLLKEEYDEYINSFSKPHYTGIRINTSKISNDEWESINPFNDLRQVPWCTEGRYYFGDRPAKHPYYFAGLYYIQEPSAMSAAEFIPINKTDKVLDLCAAPGGKSTQIGVKLGETGLLVSNDISTSRANILVNNIERFGLKNAMIVSENPAKLAKAWPSYFDKIIIDAPCSGEGMFRKDENAIKNWEKYKEGYFCEVQLEILNSAAQMLNIGGMILYSTCTFSTTENELLIEEFLRMHPEFDVFPLTAENGLQNSTVECNDKRLNGTIRLWPHKIDGEGHFICLLLKENGDNIKSSLLNCNKQIKDYILINNFINENTTIKTNQYILENSNKYYIVSNHMPTQHKLHILRSGLYIGQVKHNNFEPSHALCMAYPKDSFKNSIELDMKDAIKYLKGETLIIDVTDGYHVVCIEGYNLGWIKAKNGKLKNKYPVNLRMIG